MPFNNKKDQLINSLAVKTQCSPAWPCWLYLYGLNEKRQRQRWLHGQGVTFNVDSASTEF